MPAMFKCSQHCPSIYGQAKSVCNMLRGNELRRHSQRIQRCPNGQEIQTVSMSGNVSGHYSMTMPENNTCPEMSGNYRMRVNPTKPLIIRMFSASVRKVRKCPEMSGNQKGVHVRKYNPAYIYAGISGHPGFRTPDFLGLFLTRIITWSLKVFRLPVCCLVLIGNPQDISRTPKQPIAQQQTPLILLTRFSWNVRPWPSLDVKTRMPRLEAWPTIITPQPKNRRKL